MVNGSREIQNNQKLKQMKFNLLITSYFLVTSMSFAQESNKHYLVEKIPGLKPEIFAPDIISKENRSEFGSVFSADAKEFFYAIEEDGKATIWLTKSKNGIWTKHKATISHPTYSFNDPFLSPDEQRLYYISDRALDGKGEKKDYDIWYSTREEKGWSEPINAGNTINSTANEYYVSFTNDGSMYFASNLNASEGKEYDFDIYKSIWKENRFQQPVKLSEAINTNRYEADVFVAPDESYLIFSAARKEGMGKGDLYISFKAEDGEWTQAKNMGPLINTEGHELCPFVSKDGKYFFFTSKQDIYWVNAQVLEAYR